MIEPVALYSLKLNFLQVQGLEKQLSELTQKRIDYLEKMQEQQMSVQVISVYLKNITTEQIINFVLVGKLFWIIVGTVAVHI